MTSFLFISPNACQCPQVSRSYLATFPFPTFLKIKKSSHRLPRAQIFGVQSIEKPDNIGAALGPNPEALEKTRIITSAQFPGQRQQDNIHESELDSLLMIKFILIYTILLHYA